MMAFVIVFILFLAVLYLLNASGNGVEIVNKAFAGMPKSGNTVVELQRQSNNIIYTENGVEVDLSTKRKFYIDGISLEKAGLPDKSVVYTDTDYDVNNLESLANLFIILKIDNDRIQEEHPEIFQRIDGYKARLLVSIFPTKMEKALFENMMRCILEKDSEVTDLDSYLVHLWNKYSFASEYYTDDQILLVSITYKKGKTKDYSFHSATYLEGVIRFRDLN